MSDVAAAVGETPHADPVGVDLVERLGEGDGVAVVLDLRVGVDVLAARPVARSEIAVVEEDRCEPGVGELLCDVRLHELLDVAPAPGHDDRGEGPAAAVRRVQPAANGLATARELDVAPHRMRLRISEAIRSALGQERVLERGRVGHGAVRRGDAPGVVEIAEALLGDARDAPRRPSRR